MVNLRIEEEPHVNDEIQPIEKFVESKCVNDFQGFGALHNMSSTSMTNCALCSDVQVGAGQMCDELQQSFETCQRNVNKLTLNVKRKKITHSQKMTLHDMFEQ